MGFIIRKTSPFLLLAMMIDNCSSTEDNIQVFQCNTLAFELMPTFNKPTVAEVPITDDNDLMPSFTCVTNSNNGTGADTAEQVESIFLCSPGFDSDSDCSYDSLIADLDRPPAQCAPPPQNNESDEKAKEPRSRLYMQTRECNAVNGRQFLQMECDCGKNCLNRVYDTLNDPVTAVYERRLERFTINQKTEKQWWFISTC